MVNDDDLEQLDEQAREEAHERILREQTLTDLLGYHRSTDERSWFDRPMCGCEHELRDDETWPEHVASEVDAWLKAQSETVTLALQQHDVIHYGAMTRTAVDAIRARL